MFRDSCASGLLSLLALVVAIPASTRAECFDYSQLLRPLGSAALASEGSDVAVCGEYAFVTAGEGYPRSLQVFDVSAAHEAGGPIVPVATLPLPSCAFGIAVTSDHAYLAMSSGLTAVDISDPAQPVLQSTTGASAIDVTIHDGVALVTTHHGLDVFSLTDPGAPALIGHLALGECHEISAEGIYAYFAGGPGLVIADVSDPAHPALVATAAVPVPTYGLAIGDGYAFVAGGVRWQIETRGDLYTIDVRQPSAPLVVGHLDLGQAAGVSVGWREGVAYVSQESGMIAGNVGSLTLIDVTHPVAPRAMRCLDLPDEGRGTFIGEDRFFLMSQNYTTGIGTLRAYSTTVTPGPTLGNYPAQEMAQAVDTQDGMAYLLDWSGNFHILDVSDPQQPIQRGTLPIAAGPMTVEAWGNCAYLGFQTAGLQVVEISNPSAPLTVGMLPQILYVSKLRARGNRLYVLQNSTGLTILDITTPWSPIVRGSVSVPGYDYDFALSGDHAFIASVTSLEVVNVHDPAAPYRVGSLAIPARAIDVAGDFAIVLDSNGDVRVVDISDPAHPAQVATLDTWSFASAIVVDGDVAYLGTTAGLAAVDVSDPYSPLEIGEEGTGSLSAYGIACSPDIVLLADGAAGLVLLSKHCDAASMVTEPVPCGLRLQVTPNPLVDHAVVSFEVPSNASAEVCVYDLEGRQVVPLCHRSPAGAQALTWDGRGVGGIPVPSGIYWVRARTAGQSGALRIVKPAR